MGLRLTSLLLLLSTTVLSIIAFRIPERNQLSKDPINLSKRANYPIVPSNYLVHKIVSAIKAQIDSECLAQITANYTKTVNGSLNVGVDINLSLLGGLIRLGEIQIKAIREKAIKRMKERMEAEINHSIEDQVYSPLEQDLRIWLGSSPLSKPELYTILVNAEDDAKGLVGDALSKLDADLETRLYKELGLGITGTQITIPLIANLTVSVDVDKSATLESSIQAAADSCLDVDVNAEALKILESL